MDFLERVMIERLKKRWGVQSGVQVFIILMVFSITGTIVVLLKKPIFELFGFDFFELALWAKLIYYVFILPVYLGLLIIIGFSFGQGEFFLGFVRKFLRRFTRKSKERSEGS
jgi:Family of unknown function (DUF6787)